MAGAAVYMSSVEDSQRMMAQVEKIIRSSVFFGAETSSKLLLFLANRALNTPESSGSSLKEYEIATEVMGRKSDFDPRFDSGVRVQVARLRTKLSEYMSHEGSTDPYIVEIPRGSYKVTFTPNPGSHEVLESPPAIPADHPTHLQTSILAQETPSPVSHAAGYGSLVWIAPAVFVVLIAAAALSFFHLRREPATPTRVVPLDAAVREFWQPFLADSQGPLTILSNAPFSGNVINGLHYDQPGEHSSDVHSYYTGIGEAMSIHRLDMLFDQLEYPLRVRPGSLLTVEDLKDSNLIFIGAPVENLMIEKVIALKDFTFRELTSGPRTGQVVIDNHTPQAGEPAMYMASNTPDHPLIDDYALITRMPIDATHEALVAAGTTTIGTEAAVEYLCDPATLMHIRQKIASSSHEDAYELILHIRIVDEVPMHADIVAVRQYRLSNK
jgi:hypothetical protein